MIRLKRFEEFTIKTLLVLLSTNAFAQQPLSSSASISNSSKVQGSSATKLVIPTEAKANPFTFDFAMETSSNLYKEGEAEREMSTSFMFNPAYKFQNNFKVSLLTYVEKEQTGAEDTKMTNTDIALALPVKDINTVTHLASAVKYTVPTSEKSQKIDRLKGAAGVSAKMIRDIGESNISYKISLTKNVHDYTTNGAGAANISAKLSQAFGAAIQLSKKVSFETVFIYGIAQTYHDFKNYAYEYSADLSYEFADKQSIAIGTTNEGSALKADGKTSNMAFYDQDSSVVRASLNLSF